MSVVDCYVHFAYCYYVPRYGMRYTILLKLLYPTVVITMYDWQYIVLLKHICHLHDFLNGRLVTKHISDINDANLTIFVVI